MSHNLSFLEDESLTDNLSDEVAKQINLWLENLATTSHPLFEDMLGFVKAFNKAKVQPLSHKGKDLNNRFEIVLMRTSPNSTVVIRFAKYLIEQGAVHVTKKTTS